MILRSALALASYGRLSILVFHRVLREVDPLLPSEPCAAQFDALLRHIKARFTVLPLLDAIERLRSGTLPSAALAITLDDGYADNLAVAAPILRAHGVPATVFVASGYLDGGCMFNDVVIEAFRSAQRSPIDLTGLGLGTYPLDSVEHRSAAIENVLNSIKYLPRPERERRAQAIAQAAGSQVPQKLMLTRTSLRNLAEFGIDVGAHTVTHPILANTEPGEAWREIQQSKSDLEELIGRPVALFAYPNGKPRQDYLPDHVRMVREAGFVGAVSGVWGAASRTTDNLQLPRFTPWSRQPLKFDLLMLNNLRQRVNAA